MPVTRQPVQFREGFLQKRCARCRDWWPLFARYWWRNARGWHSWCRACCNERQAQYRAAKAAAGTKE